VVAEGDRLRHLQVREAGHRRGGVLLGEVEQGGLVGLEQRLEPVDLLAQPEADVGGHLVVARAAGVQALAGVADQRGEALLDVEMHVLVVERPLELLGLDLLLDGGHAALDGGEVVGADDAPAGPACGRGRASRGCRAGPGAGRRPPRRCSA
jgi:hypothetical protein